MKYLIPERGGFSKKEYNLRCRRLEDIIKTCTNKKMLEEFMNSFDIESRESFSTKFKENKHKHKRESMLLLLYQPALTKFINKYPYKSKLFNAVINLHNEVEKRFSIEKEINVP